MCSCFGLVRPHPHGTASRWALGTWGLILSLSRLLPQFLGIEPNSPLTIGIMVVFISHICTPFCPEICISTQFLCPFLENVLISRTNDINNIALSVIFIDVGLVIITINIISLLLLLLILLLYYYYYHYNIINIVVVVVITYYHHYYYYCYYYYYYYYYYY